MFFSTEYYGNYGEIILKMNGHPVSALKGIGVPSRIILCGPLEGNKEDKIGLFLGSSISDSYSFVVIISVRLEEIERGTGVSDLSLLSKRLLVILGVLLLYVNGSQSIDW